MKLVTYARNGSTKPGVLSPSGEYVFDLYSSAIAYLTEKGEPKPEAQADLWIGRSMLNFIEGRERSLDLAQGVLEKYAKEVDAGAEVTGVVGETIAYPLASVKLRAPIPRPTKIICIGGNYAETGKVIGMDPGKVRAKYPNTFQKAPTSVIGPDDDIIIPKVCTLLYEELELCAVIGKRGRKVSEDQAYNYIVGYTAGLDMTAHDLLVKDWYLLRGRHVSIVDPNMTEAPLNAGLAFRGKSFDTFAPIGPCIVTKDEIPDPHTLNVVLKVNGEVLQSGNTKDMVCRVPAFVEWVSAAVTIEPGDILFTGSFPDWQGLHDGDVLTSYIEKVGTFNNTCRAEE